MFASQSRAHIMQLRLQLQTTKKGSQSMVDYLQKMKTIADNLAVASQPLNEDDLILHILGGLGSDYDALVISVTSRTEPITLTDLNGLLLSHEYRLEQATVVDQAFTQVNLTTKSSGHNPSRNKHENKRNYSTNQYQSGSNG